MSAALIPDREVETQSDTPTGHDSPGETISEATTSPVEDASQFTDTSQATKKSKEKKYHRDRKKDKMPKTNILVDCYHTNLELLLPNNAIGRDLFEQVVVSLGLKEVWFFGLEFLDSKKSPAWLKLKKKVFAQEVGKKRPVCFKLKPKFYPEDVEKELIDSVAKKLFLEYIKEEIVSGSIYCPADTAVLLASFAMQELHGNYNAVLNPKGFLQDQQVLPSSTKESYELSPQGWEEKIVNLYKDHRGMSKEQATMEYLRIAQDLEMFGVNYFKIKNKKGTQLWLGVDALGINIYERSNKLEPKTGFPWSEIKSVSYRDHRFTIKPIYEESPNFVFYTDKTKINKLIMILCMGNHELYIRRRKIDVAPKDRVSSDRLTSIDTIIEEDPQQGTSYSKERQHTDDVPYSVNGYGHDYENDDEVISKYEDVGMKQNSESPITTSQPRQNSPVGQTNAERQTSPVRQKSPARETSPLRETSPSRETSPVRQESPVQQGIPSPVRHRSPVRKEHSPSPSRSNSPLRGGEEPDYATVDKESDDEGDAKALADTRPPTPPVQRPTPYIKHGDEEEQVGEIASEMLNHSSHFKQNSIYEPMGSVPVQAVIEQVPDSPPSEAANENRNDRETIVGSKEYVALLDKYEHGMFSEEFYDREVYVNDNKEMYYKLKNLFEDVSADPSKLSEEDMNYLKMKHENIDKYQTLRKIRSGYARDRIAIFEAMM